MKDNLEKLSTPFPAEIIQEKIGQGGQKIRYVPAHAVIERLNRLVGVGRWSWRVIQHEIISSASGTDILVRGELELIEFGAIYTGEDCATVAVRKGGGVVPDAIANALKAAATGALVRAARLLGIGLDLYHDGAPSEGAAVIAAEQKRDCGPVTKRQLDAIVAQARLIGWGRDALREAAGKSADRLTYAEAVGLGELLAEAAARQEAPAPAPAPAPTPTPEEKLANAEQLEMIRTAAAKLGLSDDELKTRARAITDHGFSGLTWSEAAALLENLDPEEVEL
jgi:hypothetical protein